MAQMVMYNGQTHAYCVGSSMLPNCRFTGLTVGEVVYHNGTPCIFSGIRKQGDGFLLVLKNSMGKVVARINALKLGDLVLGDTYKATE